jgi:hypothetical protein
MTAKLTVDMSAAPEIARLAEAVTLFPAPTQQAEGLAEPLPAQEGAPQLTVGTLAGRLRTLAAAPERWWGQVRFDPDRPVRITVDQDQSYTAWLMILPPARARQPADDGQPADARQPADDGHPCDCDAVTLIAGEATEGTPLRPGPIRVHGQHRQHPQHGQAHPQHGQAHPQHTLRGHGAGYTVSLHARARRVATL